MNASNIFKMEFYKNFRDKAWIIITGALAAVTLLLTVLIIAVSNQVLTQSVKQSSDAFSTTPSFTILTQSTSLLGVTTFFALGAYFIIYPFHLLSTDYNNKVLGLMVASGVKREKYYFIKLLATILSVLLATVIIFILPAILFFGFYNQQFIQLMANVFRSFSNQTAIIFFFAFLVGQLASITLLFLTVIMTRGKFWGIFVYFGVNSGLSVIWSILGFSLVVGQSTAGGDVFGLLTIFFSAIELVFFGLFGHFRISKQDL